MDQIFKSNPNLKEYFRTADGIAFFTDNAARNHARSLENKTITTVKNNKQEKGAPETSKTDNESAIANSESPIENPQSEISNSESAIENTESAIENPKSAIENPKSAIKKPKTPKAQ
jgi:hypothetical protein